MKMNVTFRHSDSSAALQNYILGKLNRLSKYFIKPTNIHIILNVENHRHVAEIVFSENHSLFNTRVMSHNMYHSVNQALSKLERQLKKYKEKLKDHKFRKVRSAIAFSKRERYTTTPS